jgi:protein dispatched 1
LLAYQLGIKRELFGGYIHGDIIYALIACGAVLLIMWWYTNSLRVTVLAFLEILTSLGLGFFVYCTVLRMPQFPMMNATTIFLAIGIGADDVFVYVDSWRHSRTEVPRNMEGGRETDRDWKARR